MAITHKSGSYLADLEARIAANESGLGSGGGLPGRVSALEDYFSNPSAYVSDVSYASVEILGIAVGTSGWGNGVTTAINNIKNCLVAHDLMAAS